MSCLTLLVMTDCQTNSTGGAVKMYMGKESTVTSVFDPVTAVYTTFTSTDNPVEITLRKDSLDFADALANDYTNGSTVYNSTLNITSYTATPLSKKAVNAMAVGQPLLYIVVKSANGTNWVLRNMRLQSDGGVHGRTLADGNNHTLVFNGQDDSYATTITDAQLTTLLT